MLAFVEKYFKDVLICAGLVVLAVVSVTWVREHDARILAEQTVKESAARVATLEQQSAASVKDTQAKVVIIQQKAAEVKTPAQAIAALPDVSTLPLNARPLPDAPSAVQVDAVPLYQQLSLCKAQSVELDGCKQQLGIAGQVSAEKDTQIKALAQRKTFWRRLGKGAKVIGCSAGGAALGSAKGAEGAAIGAAAGAGLCSLF